jgi:hypothetical protein
VPADSSAEVQQVVVGSHRASDAYRLFESTAVLDATGEFCSHKCNAIIKAGVATHIISFHQFSMVTTYTGI